MQCSGRPAPCKACRSQDTEADCVFDLTLDLRRKVAQRRTIDEREYYRHVLSSLLYELRSSEPVRLNELINFIRTDASMGRIATVLADTTISLDDFSSVGLDSNPSVETAIQSLHPPPDPESSRACSRITLESLVDIPLFQVPAKPWTTVTDDDGLVSHLISLYFTWDHPCWQLVNQTAFLLHMRTGDLSSEYCTPFLVNSILAIASVYSDAPDVFAIPGNADSCGSHFHMEAERLWKAEEGTVSLANIQGLVIMCHVLKCQGKNAVSWLMLRQAVQLAQDFGMFQAPRALHANWQEMPADAQRVHTMTAWGVFVMNLDMSMELRKNANLEPPVCRPFTEDDLDDDVAWTPYPRSNQVKYAKKPGLLRYVATELANLTEITADIQRLFFINACHMGVNDLWRKTNELYSRLQQWRENIPGIMMIHDHPVPQVLFLHIKYHQTILSLFDAFVGHKSPDDPSHPLWFEQATRIRVQSAKDIARCFRILGISYGYKRIPSHMLEAASTSLLVVMGDLTNEESRNAFMELCRIVIIFSKRLKQAKCVIPRVMSIAQQSGISLPPEAILILEGSESGP